MKKLFFLFVSFLATTCLWAYEFRSGDLYYNITSESNPYTVEVSDTRIGITIATIPENVTYNGTTYSVTSIGGGAFAYCSSLTSVTIPNSVTSIGVNAFKDCSSLTSVTIPNGVTSIGYNAFEYCSSLTSVTIPNGVTSIGEYAFYDCSSLTSVTIGESVTSIGVNAFYGCSKLTKTNYTGDIAGWCNITFESIESNPMFYSHNFYIDNVEIKDLVIPNSVTSIGRSAFYYCSSLTSVTIPNSVTSIGEEAFFGCSKLTKTNYTGDIAGWCNIEFGAPCANPMYYSHNFYINGKEIKDLVIPNSVTSIGSSAFYGCSSLTSITIPNSVASIGRSAFYYCSSLTSVTINSDAIVSKAYSDASNISHIFGSQVTEYIIGESVTSIGNSAFEDCSSLTSVTIPNSVTSIGYNAFKDCSSLTSVTIPNGVTSIGSYTFCGCTSLTSVTIPNSVTRIRDRAFYGCSSLTSVTIPNGVTSIGSSAFYGCSSLTSVTINSDAIVSQAYSDASNISHIFGSQVTEYIIGERVTSIGDNAFYGCSSLTSITIPNSVTSIGSSAFYYCSSLTSVTINSDAIVSKAYSDASNISHIFGSQVTEYIIGESVTSIGNSAFEDCSSLTSVTIGDSVTSIGDYAFYGCFSLTSPVYNAHCFAYMPTSYSGAYTIPEGIEQIAGSAFYDCSSLTSITIPNSVTSIGKSAFDGCSSLTSVIIPNSVTSIGNGVFQGCSSLTSPVYNAHCFAYMQTSYSGAYTIPEGIKQIVGQAFYGCSSLTSVTIPESVTSIGGSAFYGCSSLTSVTIPNSVTSIGSFAFYYCSSLTSVTIPNSVTSIGSFAFDGCSSLTSVTCKAETPPTVGSYAFYNVSKSIPVYVPCECVEAYKAANGWKNFTNIQELLAEYSIEVYVNDTIMGTAKVNYNTFCEGAQISASPNIGYHFVQWSDGNTDTIRTLVLTQDTTLTAEFAQSFSGQCGDSLYWELVDTTLQITGKGEMYDYKSDSAPWKLLVSSIKVLTIAEDVTKLSQSFDSCSVLESIVWNAKHAADAYSDGQYVYPIFYGIRSQITSFTFGEAVEYIPTYLCVGMDKLTSMIIPNSVTSIGGGAFYGCSALTSVTIPESVTSIGKSAFEGCSALEFVVWNVKNCANASSLETAPFYGITSQIKSFTFGEAVEHVPAYLCYGMEKLTNVSLPNKVKTIGTSAFEGCVRLGKISLGTGLEEIAANAFAGCTRLYDIYVYATYPPFAEESSFANYNVYVYVPCEYQRDYTLDPVWGKFQHIECLSDEPTDIENIKTPSQRPTNVQKLLRNGNLVIIRDGVEYNAMGQEL